MPSSQPGNGRKKRISVGDLDGRWTWLLKAVLIFTPIAWAVLVTFDLPWRVWVTRSVYQSIGHIESTDTLCNDLKGVIEKHDTDFRDTQQQISDLPPPQWKKRVEALEGYDRENREDHTRIMISLEAIKTQLGLPPSNHERLLGGTYGGPSDATATIPIDNLQPIGVIGNQ